MDLSKLINQLQLKVAAHGDDPVHVGVSDGEVFKDHGPITSVEVIDGQLYVISDLD